MPRQNSTQMVRFVSDRIGNIVGKGENSTKSFPKRPDLRLSRTKSWQTTFSNFRKNGRKFSKRVENTVGKGEIPRYEAFSPFPLVFSED